jgi:hypothetical protein
MEPGLTARLSREEFDALREVGKTAMQRVIPVEHRDRLMTLGLIRQALGGLMLTDAGKLRLAAGR